MKIRLSLLIAALAAAAAPVPAQASHVCVRVGSVYLSVEPATGAGVPVVNGRPCEYDPAHRCVHTFVDGMEVVVCAL